MTPARLPMILAVVFVTLAGVAGMALLRLPPHDSAEQPVAAPAASGLPLPAVPLPAVPPLPAVTTAGPAKAPDPAAAFASPDPLPPLLTELNAALPKLGVPPPARLTAATVENNLLVLTFNTEFRSHLSDLSALDELTAALSSRTLAHGYRNLDLRMADVRGRTRSLAELTTTLPARRPRPEPIDDGVRR